MAARRNVLNGASGWAREEKANQQRDYAAQLQEQVLQKQAKQEQDKVRRQQEQRKELEILERERVAATRKHQPQQEQRAPEPPLPAQSPQRSGSTPHRLGVEFQQQRVHVMSPLKFASSDPSINPVVPMAEPVQHIAASVPTTNFESDSYTPAFSSAPSIFESLLREPGISARSITFYDELAALQRLAVELDSAAKQRRTKAQSNYVKPNFLYQQETSAASPTTISTAVLRSSVEFSANKVNQEDKNQLNKQDAVLRTQSQSNLDGMLGESILLPLSTTIPSPKFSHSKAISRAGDSPIKPLHRFTAAVTTEDDGKNTMEVLANHSEMLAFTVSES